MIVREDVRRQKAAAVGMLGVRMSWAWASAVMVLMANVCQRSVVRDVRTRWLRVSLLGRCLRRRACVFLLGAFFFEPRVVLAARLERGAALIL